MNINAYLPYKGGSISGFGEITKPKESKFSYQFINESGRIMFNSVEEMQVKGMKIIIQITDEDLKKLKID